MREARSKSTTEEEEPVEEYEEDDVAAPLCCWGKLEQMRRGWSLDGTDAGVPIEFLRLRSDKGAGSGDVAAASSSSSSSIVKCACGPWGWWRESSL